MSLPANVTCNVYRHGHAPPSAPAVGGVAALLMARFRQGLETGQGLADATQRFTHVALVASDIDVRDAYLAANPDMAFVDGDADFRYQVVFVERRLRGSGLDHLRVYLSRQPIPLGAG